MRMNRKKRAHRGFRIHLPFVCGAMAAASVFAFGPPGAAFGQPAETKAAVPLVLEKSIPIPGVPVWPYSDVMALDLDGGRIFATPQAAKAVVVIDLNSGRVL